MSNFAQSFMCPGRTRRSMKWLFLRVFEPWRFGGLLRSNPKGARTRRLRIPEFEAANGAISKGSTLRLVVQDCVEEAAMDRQSTGIIVNEAELPELVPEMTDPCPGRADHFGQRILIYL